jgi:hypothetical protein
MRSAIIVACGFLLWGVCLAAAKWVPAAGGPPLRTATVVFAVLWFCAAAINLWVGVSKAGYTFAEELPIFLGIFLVPTAVAALVTWKLL